MKLYKYNGALFCSIPEEALPKNVIFDTDWLDDVDDVVAIRILSWGVKTKKINLIGVVLDAVRQNTPNDSVASLSCVLNYEGLGDTQIGADKSNALSNNLPNWYKAITDNWGHKKYADIASVMDSTAFYRKILSETDGKTDIVCVGFLNSIDKLLSSTSDSYSPLNGVQLVNNKVNKIWCMGGRYPVCETAEWNFARNDATFAKTASHNVCANCPVPIIFVGAEVGGTVISGNTIAETLGTDDLIYIAMEAYGASEGRASHDPLTALLAIRNNADKAGYDLTYGTNSVNASTGINTFTASETGKHAYVTKRHSDSDYAYELNQILEKHGW